MSSDECLQREGSSDMTESIEATNKKKRSFHPLRSLKRLFGHGGGGSSHRRLNIDTNEDSSNLLKTRSTTDVIIVSKETTKQDVSAFQKPSKQISLSADSIFSTERTCEKKDSDVQSCNINALLQHKDDDEGLPQSPFTLATSTGLLIENGLKEQSEKWPSFDSGHSLLSVESYDNETKEDFFQEKWLASSKTSLCDAASDTSGAERSFHEDFDFNLVQQHSRLISSAAIHRLAVRPKGKRVSSVYQQKFSGTVLKPPTAMKSLPLVKEESSTTEKMSEDYHLDCTVCPEKVDNTFSIEKRDTARSPNKKNADRVSAITGICSNAKNVCGINNPEKDDVAQSPVTNDVMQSLKKPEATGSTMKYDFAKTNEKVSPNRVKQLSIAADSETYGQSLTDAQKEELKMQKIFSVTVSEPADTEYPDEASNLAKSFADTLEKDAIATVKLTADEVVVRQKPPLAVVPSEKEIHEKTARRQMLAFAGEIGEKPVSNKSSMAILDHQLVPVKAGNTELAQMFSKFQCRSSQRKHYKLEESKLAENEHKRSSGGERTEMNYIQSASTSKGLHEVTSVTEQIFSVKVLPEVSSSEMTTEILKKTGFVVGIENSRTEEKHTNVENMPLLTHLNNQEKSSCKIRSYDGGDKIDATGGLRCNEGPSASEQPEHKKSVKDVENKTQFNAGNIGYNYKRTEKSLEKSKEPKNKITSRVQTREILSKAEDAPKIYSTAAAHSSEKAKTVKKSHSISYKAASSSKKKKVPTETMRG